MPRRRRRRRPPFAQAPLLAWRLGLTEYEARARGGCPAESLTDEAPPPPPPPPRLEPDREAWAPAGATTADQRCPAAVADEVAAARLDFASGAAAAAYARLRRAGGACCDPFREASSWFLGEAPAASSLNGSASSALEAALAVDLGAAADADWRDIAAFSFAAPKSLLLFRRRTDLARF